MVRRQCLSASHIINVPNAEKTDFVTYNPVGDFEMAKNVLTVDDSKTMRDMVTFTLQNAGLNVVEAKDGEDALHILNNDGVKFDLIITDLNMPVMDGFALIENVRAHEKYKYIPILMLTTESDSQKKRTRKIARRHRLDSKTV